MLTIYPPGLLPMPLEIDDYCVKELETGLDELQFEVNIWNADYLLMQEETPIVERSDGTARYIIAAIDGGEKTATVKAVLDLDEWKSGMLLDFDSEEATVGAIVAAVKPAGWTVSDRSGMTATNQVTSPGATPLEILEQCREAFPGVTYRFNNISRTVTIIDMDSGPQAGTDDRSGGYLTRQLNLRACNFKGKSAGLVTRLYVYGANGLSFASINGGKAYVENYSYTSRVKAAYVADDRFTDAATMLAWATERVAQLAAPERSYECDVVDLARAIPPQYGFLSFPLFTRVPLIDETRSAARLDLRVMARWRWPVYPEKNKVMLSTIAPRIQTQVRKALAPITASRLGPGSVGSRALNAAVKAEIKDAKDTADDAKDKAEAANTLATTANTLAGTAKDTADSAKDDAAQVQSNLTDLVNTLKASATYQDFRAAAKDKP